MNTAHSKNSPRIVITATGAVCGAGLTADAVWDAVQSGRSAIAPIKQWDASLWPAGKAAEVLADNRTLVPDRKLHKILSRTDMFGLFAADAAVQQSGLIAFRETLDEKAKDLFNDRSGIFVGSGGGVYQCNYDFFPVMTTAAGDMQTFGREVSSSVNPMWLLKNLPNNVLCHVGIRHLFKGANACITNQCVGSIMAVVEAAAAIRADEADRATVVGHDAPIEPETVFHYARLGLMSNDTLRPFDRNRSGTVFGEGAASVILEKESDAKARNAQVLGEYLGSGCITEGTGILHVQTSGDGLARAIRIALADAGLSSDAIGMIVAHGNGTPASDASEAAAIHTVFGDNPPPVTGFKWATGHLIAASGIIDLVLTLVALRQQIVPGIQTLEALDPALAPLPVSSQPQKPRSDTALVLCRGFGGMNVAVVLRSFNTTAG